MLRKGQLRLPFFYVHIAGIYARNMLRIGMADTPRIALPNRWLYIDFNSYFASVEQQLRPQLRGKPIAVVAVETDATSAIAASYEAKAFGIKTGTPIWEAKKRCPNLVCVLANHEHYVAFHNRILAEVENHIPVSRVCSIDEVACVLMRNENSVTRATEIAHAIKRGLAQNIGEYITCSIGIAPNRYLAKIATDMQKPNGLTFLHAQDLPEKLYSLALRDLPGIGHNMEQRLRRHGIHDVRTICAMSATDLRKAWGSVWGERMYYYLRGIELPEIETRRSSIGHSHVLAPEMRPVQQARHVARRLTLKCASRLRRMGYTAGAMSLSMREEAGTRYATDRQCIQACDSLTFLHLLDSMWHDILTQHHPKRFKKLSVTLHQLREASASQTDLFDTISNEERSTRAKAERMSHALDALNHRFGRDTVSVGMLPHQGRSFSGTKIAFTRIPDTEEFFE